MDLVKSDFNCYLFDLILFLFIIIFYKIAFKTEKLADLLHDKCRSVMKRMQNMCTIRFPAELTPTASFWRLIYWGCFGLFSIRFEVGFQASFSYLSKCLSPLVLELILTYQKESFQEGFQKEIS